MFITNQNKAHLYRLALFFLLHYKVLFLVTRTDFIALFFLKICRIKVTENSHISKMSNCAASGFDQKQKKQCSATRQVMQLCI